MATCLVILTDTASKTILLRKNGSGFELPQVVFPNGWAPNLVGPIAQNVAKLLGTRSRVLRFSKFNETLLCEIELLRLSKPVTASEYCLVGIRNYRTLSKLDLNQQAALQFVTNGRRRSERASTLAPWEIPGWFKDAETWIRSQVERIGGKAVKVDQFKGGWGKSCILRVTTNLGTLFFKASPEGGMPESHVIKTLELMYPSNLPELIAVDKRRRWILMKDFGRASLAGDDISFFKQAVSFYGTIQISSTSQFRGWLSHGCPDWRVHLIPTLFEEVLRPLPGSHKPKTSRTNDPRPKALEAILPKIGSLCSRLDAIRIPPALVNPDLSPSNIRNTNKGMVFYDWSGVMISHPFFSLTRFLYCFPGYCLNRSERYDAENVKSDMLSLSTAYLKAWEEFAPIEDLFEALTLVSRLSPVFQVIRWHREFLASDPSSLWGAELSGARRNYLHACTKL